MTDLAVVVPVYNDPEGVRTTVESLRPQVTGADARLYVVDNGSTDGTPAVIDEYADGDSIVGLEERDVQSSYAARNAGIRASEGDVLAFVDADMTVSEGWLEAALGALESTGVDYLGCDVELVLPADPSLAARFDAHTGFPVRQYMERQGFAPTCCLVVRREVLAEVGRFDHRLVSGGDKEFGNRVAAAGYDLGFASDATMYHPVRDSLSALVRKDLRVGRGHCQLQRFHPDRYGTPGIPPRPSGIKSPERDLPGADRLAFGALSTLLTGVRGLGYYREFLAGERRDDLEGVPAIEP